MGKHFIPHIHHFQSLCLDRSPLFVCHCWKHSPCLEEEKTFCRRGFCLVLGVERQTVGDWNIYLQKATISDRYVIHKQAYWANLSFHLVVYPTKMINQVLLLKQHRSDMDWGFGIFYRDPSISALPSAHILRCINIYICIYIYMYIYMYM